MSVARNENEKEKRDKSFCSPGSCLENIRISNANCSMLQFECSCLCVVVAACYAIMASNKCMHCTPNGNSVGEICGIITRAPKPQCSNEQATESALNKQWIIKSCFNLIFLFQLNDERHWSIQRKKTREIKARTQQANSIWKATTTAAIRHTTQMHKWIVWKEMSWKEENYKFTLNECIAVKWVSEWLRIRIHEEEKWEFEIVRSYDRCGAGEAIGG